MKQITAVALLSIGSFVTAGRALAQDRAVQATVPFDFTVGNTDASSWHLHDYLGIIRVSDSELRQARHDTEHVFSRQSRIKVHICSLTSMATSTFWLKFFAPMPQ